MAAEVHKHYVESFDGLEPVKTFWSGNWEYCNLYAGQAGDSFRINMGGADYYASDELLTHEEALHLHQLLGEYLANQ